jgi:hypothetical protein
MAEMTQQEALIEAHGRWGPYGYVAHSVECFYVGNFHSGLFGRGDSWEAAFEDADRKEKERNG